MVQIPAEELLATCFQEVTGSAPISISLLHPHASERRIYRLSDGRTTLVGVANHSRAENDSFVALARHFKSHNLPVPEIYAYKPDQGIYVEEYLGETTLLDYLASERNRSGESFPKSVETIYERVLDYLPRFQIEAARDLDFSICRGSQDFFSKTLANDLRSFSRELVGRMLPSFDTSSLERDFQALITYVNQAQSSYFLYRDFQSRNIMLVNHTPYFIDFQSGHLGPLQYDVVSLLYQASAQIPENFRESLARAYLDSVARHTQCSSKEFFRFYPAFIISRMLQVLGVYGYQGLGAGKEYFTKSIPTALKTLENELRSPHLGVKLESLLACSQALLKSKSI